MEVPEGGFWMCPAEPSRLDEAAMLQVAPETGMWLTPMETGLHPNLAPPDGRTWN